MKKFAIIALILVVAATCAVGFVGCYNPYTHEENGFVNTFLASVQKFCYTGVKHPKRGNGT